MRLSAKEGTVLAAAELRADAPAQLLRRETGLREHTVRYALSRLRSRGVCIPLPFINLPRMGYVVFNIFFTVSAQRKAANEALIRAFVNAPEVVWVGEFGGEFQYGIAICTKQIGSALELISALSNKFKQVFFDKAISIQSGTTVYARRYLSSKRFSAKPLRSRHTPEVLEIDDLDRRILIALAEPGDFSNRQLSQKLGIPASTVDLRIRKLTESGIIVGQFLAVDCTKYGYQSYKLLIYAKGMNPDLSAGLQRFSENHLNVTYVIECLGSWDYELGVEVASSEQVTRIMQEIFEEFGAAVHTVKLLSKFRDIKFRWFPGN